MKKLLRKLKYDDRGMPAIEAAFCFPLLILMFISLFELTSAISINRRVTLAASVMADLVTRHNTSILKTEITDYYNAAEMAMSPTPSATVRVELFGYRKAGATISRIWKSNNGLGSSCGADPGIANMDPLMVSGNDLVVARVCTTYTPIMTSFMGTTFFPNPTLTVSETITDRPRISTALTCYDTVVGGAVCS
jgi:Flp pilus assembly protein TadG